MNSDIPVGNPLTLVVALSGDMMPAEPLVLQLPDPDVGDNAVIGALVAHTVKSPAVTAGPGGRSRVMVSVDAAGGHTPLETVQTNVFGPP